MNDTNNTLGCVLIPHGMNIFGAEFTADIPSEQRVETGGETPPEPIPIQTLRGGDASDILPEDLLRRKVAEYKGSDGDVAETARMVRGEFASLQRVLETRIARYDSSLEVLFEDDELIIYRLERALDFEYILDFCEIEGSLTRHVIVESMEAIATDRAADGAEYPLVVRKPTAFRAGERHARARLSRSTNHDD